MDVDKEIVMKIIEGIRKIKGMPGEIPDSNRDDFPEFLVEMGCKIGAEIGVLEGEFTEVLCKAGLKMYAVDPWLKRYNRYRRHPRENMEDTYQRAKDRLSNYDCTMIRKFSREALLDFEDGSLDFVFIDGNHSLPYIVEDIWGWNLKVKRGGIVSGHDYVTLINNPYSSQACHVQHGVDVSALLLGIKNFYVLGEFRPKLGDKRDKTRCWFWVKP